MNSRQRKKKQGSRLINKGPTPRAWERRQGLPSKTIVEWTQRGLWKQTELMRTPLPVSGSLVTRCRLSPALPHCTPATPWLCSLALNVSDRSPFFMKGRHFFPPPDRLLHPDMTAVNHWFKEWESCLWLECLRRMFLWLWPLLLIGLPHL